MAADILITSPARVTATADGTDHEIQFHDNLKDLLAEKDIAFIVVNSGTFKFSVGGPTSQTNSSFTGEVPPLKFENGVINIIYQCTSAGNFDITFI